MGKLGQLLTCSVVKDFFINEMEAVQCNRSCRMNKTNLCPLRTKGLLSIGIY